MKNRLRYPRTALRPLFSPGYSVISLSPLSEPFISQIAAFSAIKKLPVKEIFTRQLAKKRTGESFFHRQSYNGDFQVGVSSFAELSCS